MATLYQLIDIHVHVQSWYQTKLMCKSHCYHYMTQDISRQLPVGRSFMYILERAKVPVYFPGEPCKLLALDNAPLTLHLWDLLHK